VEEVADVERVEVSAFLAVLPDLLDVEVDVVADLEVVEVEVLDALLEVDALVALVVVVERELLLVVEVLFSSSCILVTCVRNCPAL